MSNIVQQNSAFSTVDTNTMAAALTAAPTVGNTLVAFVRGANWSGASGQSITAVADDATGGSNSWTFRKAMPAVNPDDKNRVEIWTAPVDRTKTGGITVTATYSSTCQRREVVLFEVSGLDNSTLLMDHVSAQGSSAAPSAGNLTLTGAGARIFAAFVVNNNYRTGAAGSGYTSVAAANMWTYTLYEHKQAAAGTVAADFTVSPSDNWAALAVALKESAAAPTITGPSGASVTAPSTANFSASVSGTYTGLRWQRQAAGAGAWADVVGGTGGTTTSYTTGATSVSGGSFNSTDRFRLAVDWSGGTVLSTDVALTVSAAGAAPSITSQPTAQTVTRPATATFSVTAAGSGTLTYQWQRQPAAGGGYVNIAGANSASYTTPATTASGGSANNGDTYRCVVTGDTSPPATSNAVALTVQEPIATMFTLTLNNGNSLTGLKYAVFDQVTPDLWVAPIKKATNGSSNGSGLVTIDVTGLTARRIGELGSAFITNSDGTITGGSQAATRKAAYYVGVFS